jgi:hypothetical protein
MAQSRQNVIFWGLRRKAQKNYLFLLAHLLLVANKTHLLQLSCIKAALFTKKGILFRVKFGTECLVLCTALAGAASCYENFIA